MLKIRLRQRFFFGERVEQANEVKKGVSVQGIDRQRIEGCVSRGGCGGLVAVPSARKGNFIKRFNCPYIRE